jgi:hypothetical protein
MATQHTNLTMHREGPNVWDRQARQDSRQRAMSSIGLLMIAGGTCLVAHAHKARLSCALRMRIRSLFEGRKRDNVNKVSNDSFPASDPPSWNAAVGKPAGAEHPV